MFVYAKVSDIEQFLRDGAWNAGWYDQYGWEYPWIHAQLLQHARTGARLLDVGAGSCQVSRKIKEDRDDIEMHVLDEKEAFAKLGGLHHDQLVYHYGLAGGTNNLSDAAFDIVYSVSVLEHAHEAGGDEAFMNALQDMKRWLKPGGLMIHAMDIILDPQIYRRWLGFDVPRFLRALDMDPVPAYLPPPPTRDEMVLDPDLFVVSPQTAYELKWFGRNVGLDYFRLTAIGFILRKREQ